MSHSWLPLLSRFQCQYRIALLMASKHKGTVVHSSMQTQYLCQSRTLPALFSQLIYISGNSYPMTRENKARNPPIKSMNNL